MRILTKISKCLLKCLLKAVNMEKSLHRLNNNSLPLLGLNRTRWTRPTTSGRGFRRRRKNWGISKLKSKRLEEGRCPSFHKREQDRWVTGCTATHHAAGRICTNHGCLGCPRPLSTPPSTSWASNINNCWKLMPSAGNHTWPMTCPRSHQSKITKLTWIHTRKRMRIAQLRSSQQREK